MSRILTLLIIISTFNIAHAKGREENHFGAASEHKEATPVEAPKVEAAHEIAQSDLPTPSAVHIDLPVAEPVAVPAPTVAPVVAQDEAPKQPPPDEAHTDVHPAVAVAPIVPAPTEAPVVREIANTAEAPKAIVQVEKKPEFKREIGPVNADTALRYLVNGNKRFTTNRLRNDGTSKADIERLAKGQKPHAIVLSCSDSRVPPEIVFDQKLGEIFVVRTASETLDSSAIASIEYAVSQLGTNLIVVMGNESCGTARVPASAGESWANVESVATDLAARSEIIQKAMAPGELHIEKAFYHLNTGTVDWK